MDSTGRWKPSPAYDVTFDIGPGGEHSTSIAGEGARPGPTAFGKVAEAFGIKKKRAADILDEVDSAVDQWPTFAQTYGVHPKTIREIQHLFRTARGWG